MLKADLGRTERPMARKDDDDDVPTPIASLAKLERLARLLRQAGHTRGLNPVQWEALRYLSRCNALSHSPGAMARYLSSTKGTVSQTVKALAAKGLVLKTVDAQDQRGVALFLTEAGKALLKHDDTLVLQADIAELSDKTRRRFDRALDALLEQERLRQGEPGFGSCNDCRYYRQASTGLAAHCMKVNATVSVAETTLICIEHVRRI
jgi:DNA-binding MarR family transcriptional regulator